VPSASGDEALMSCMAQRARNFPARREREVLDGVEAIAMRSSESSGRMSHRAEAGAHGVMVRSSQGSEPARLPSIASTIPRLERERIHDAGRRALERDAAQVRDPSSRVSGSDQRAGCTDRR
jgi:hypothetical protein